MKPLRIYACEGVHDDGTVCGVSILRPRRTDRKRYCPDCAAAAVARNARALHAAAQLRRGRDTDDLVPALLPAHNTRRIA